LIAAREQAGIVLLSVVYDLTVLNNYKRSNNSGWLPWQQGSVMGKFEGHRSIGGPRKPPIWSKRLARIFKGGRVIGLALPSL